MYFLISVNIGQTIFEAISRLVSYVDDIIRPANCARNPLLVSYIQYSAELLHPENMQHCK